MQDSPAEIGKMGNYEHRFSLKNYLNFLIISNLLLCHEVAWIMIVCVGIVQVVTESARAQSYVSS